MPLMQNTATKDDENFPKTLYVGNLSPQVSESLIMELFGVIGPVKSCKMIADPHGLDPYCFVEFFNHGHALAAHGAMNQRTILGKEIKVNWATRPAGKRDTSNHHHIFVGDLAPETTSEDLKSYFSKIGEVSDARVMRDLQNNKSKGYGFVSFVNYQDAQDIVEKKAVLPDALHGRQVRCNWAARKGGQQPTTNVQRLDYNVILNQASTNNCTVYLGGCMSGLTEQLMREAFTGFGNIVEVRVFPDKGYAFIRLDNHADAARAITSKHGTQLEGYTIKCSWGKEGASNMQQQMPVGYANGANMDNMQMNWSQAGSDMWGHNQQQQYNHQWATWGNQSQQPQQQQQNAWNAWSQNPMQNNANNAWAGNNSMPSNSTWANGQMSNNSSPWGPMAANNTWATNNQNQQQPQQQPQNWGGWPQMGQAGGDGWNGNMPSNGGDQMTWNNWNYPHQQPQQQQQQQPMDPSSQSGTAASGDPGSGMNGQANNEMKL